ncbi:MAG: hypothetical protein ABR538_06470 [Candidatus Binatia bacterium]
MTTESRQGPTWKRCGVCKRELGFEEEFYECSVSTCTSGRHHPVFCSVNCWDQHVPVMRHRDAWAEQKRSPSRRQWEASQGASGEDGSAATPRRIVVDARTPGRAPAAPALPDEVLVVASRLKAYVRGRSGMNTSESVLDELTRIIREHTDRAMEKARQDGRKTVMDRDFRPD